MLAFMHHLTDGQRLLFGPGLMLMMAKVGLDTARIVLKVPPGVSLAFGNRKFRIPARTEPATYSYDLPLDFKIFLSVDHHLTLLEIKNEVAEILETYPPDLEPARLEIIPL